MKLGKHNSRMLRKDILIVRGEDNLRRWIDKIGFSNLSKLIKIIIWEKYGNCPPHMDLFQRIGFTLKSDKFNLLVINKILENIEKRFKVDYDIDSIKRLFGNDQMRLLIARKQAESSLV